MDNGGWIETSVQRLFDNFVTHVITEWQAEAFPATAGAERGDLVRHLADKVKAGWWATNRHRFIKPAE
jgi:hypothetical protein